MVILSFVYSLCAAAEEPWRVESKKDGIAVYSRAVDGSTYREVRASTLIKSDLKTLVTIIRNPTYRMRWDQLLENYQIEREELSGIEQVYLHHKLPWPVADRDMVMSVNWSKDQNTGVLIAECVALVDQPVRKGSIVRVEKATSLWTLSPLESDAGVLLDMQTFVDPNGPLPAWLLNRLSVKSPREALTLIRELAESGKVSVLEDEFLAGVLLANGPETIK